jgi:hypothetical protein
MGSPVWSREIIAVANARKGKVKLTFSHGRAFPILTSFSTRASKAKCGERSIFFEGDKINERALKNLIRAAVDYNQIKLKKKTPTGARAEAHKSKKA